MSGLDTTIEIAVAHVCIYLLAALYIRRPALSLLNLYLVTSTIAFGVRPILAATHGGFTLYKLRDPAWTDYNLGLILQLAFAGSFLVGYFVRHKRLRQIVPRVPFRAASPIVALSAGCLAVAAIQLLSHGLWLPWNRGDQTITSVVPLGKVLFPLAVIPLSLVLPLGYLAARNRAYRLARILIPFAPAAALLVLLYQRGFLITSIIALLFVLSMHRRVGYLSATLVGLLLVGLLGVIRPIASGTFSTGGLTSIGRSLTGGVVDVLMKKPNFDQSDVWPIVISYVNDRGLLDGTSFLATPARVLPPQLRRRLGFSTAVDTVNRYYWGRVYDTTHFGFNLTLAQELYLNFGIGYLLLGFIPGMLTAMADNWMRRVSSIGEVEVAFLAGLVLANGFTRALGGMIQWLIAYVLIGWLLSRVGAILAGGRDRASGREDASPLHLSTGQ